MQTSLPSSGLTLHIMQCSPKVTSLILPSIDTRVQMTLMETRSLSSVVFVMFFSRQSFYISWRKDQQKQSLLELILLVRKFWTFKAMLLVDQKLQRSSRASSSPQRKIKFTAFPEKRNNTTQALRIVYLQDSRILATDLEEFVNAVFEH